jgi:ubiquitin-conjugating enzyme E2 O
VVDPQYEIVKTTELQPSAEELSEEKQTLELAAQVEKPNLSSGDDIPKRFDIVADYSDHHFLKENGHKNVMLLLLKISLHFFFFKQWLLSCIQNSV